LWEVKVGKDVLRRAEKLPPANRKKLLEFIKGLYATPFPQGFDVVPVKGKKAKKFGKRGVYRARIGEYRLIYTVNWEDRIISLVELNPRGRAYK